MSKELQHLSEQIFQASATVNEIGNASIRVFELFYSTTFNLQQIRKQKYDAMVASDRSKIDLVLLPPSPRAAFFHGLRVHYQIFVWKDLSKVDKKPLRWGCKIENSNYTPIMTDNAVWLQGTLWC